MSVRVVRVQGDATRRGELIGSELAWSIRRSLTFYRRFLHGHGLDSGRLPAVLGPYREAAEAAYPRLVEEIDAAARGAGVSPWELFAVNAFEELEPSVVEGSAPAERCTAFVVDGPDGTILGHNEQWYEGDAGNVAVVVEVPEEGPSFASPTVVTCLPAVGMNSEGCAQAIASLVASDDRVGIPRVVVSRDSLQSSDPGDAVARATPDGRAGGYAHLYAFRDAAPLAVETSATGTAVLPATRAHTNHYLDVDLAAAAPEPSPGSAARLARVRSLLDREGPRTPVDVMRVLGDHSPGQAICVHPTPGDEESDAIMFSMVCDLGRRRMWVAPGQPCETRFEEIDLDGVVA